MKLQVRGQDVWKKRTHVYLGAQLVVDVRFVDVRFVNVMSAYVPFLKDNEWDVTIAPGFDASVVGTLTCVLLCPD